MWSASKAGTYKSCKLKFYYTYINKFIPSEKANTELADKGTAFHETAEHYVTGQSHEEAKNYLHERCKALNVDVEKYNEDAALERFFIFWEEFVAKRENEGWKVFKEAEVRNKINGEDFIGFLDLCLESPDGDIIITDYKSGKSGNASSYKTQQVLYAYMKGIEKGWSIEETAKRVKLYIFFPFTEQSKPITQFDKMLASVKEIKYSAQDMEDIINDLVNTVNSSNTVDWVNIDKQSLAEFNYTCNFCPFLGSVEDGEFPGCKCSYDKGFRQKRGLKFTSKEKKA